MSKQNKVPKTKINPKDVKPIPSAKFDIGKMVFNYMIAMQLQRHFVETGHPLQVHFGGIIHGYDDWFEVLNITQDMFDMVFDKIPRDKIIAAVEDLIPKFKAQWEKQAEGKGKIIIPGQNPTGSKAMMDEFKKTLKVK